ncbi:MAG TPA: hypothetical protein VJB39_00665 [Patescibacteria group bacterium]|nr:hypothetical protein [Patescibacteria group bacterium]
MPHKIIKSLLIVIILAAFFLLFYKTELFNIFKTNQTTPDLNNLLDKKATVLVKVRLDNSGLQDIYVKLDNGREVFYGSYADIYNGHYHWAEYHNGRVYFIRRVGSLDGDDWRDELWRLDARGRDKKIYSLRGFDFRVSPDEKFIAIDSEEQLFIRNQSDQKNISFSVSDLALDNPAIASLVGWSDNSQFFWGDVHVMSKTVNFFRFNSVTGAVDKFVAPPDYYGRDLAFNLNAGAMVYSDYPFFFDSNDDEQFIASQAIVKLKLHDLFTQKEIVIAESKTKLFFPRWINDSTVEYNNPDGEGRLQFNN